MRPPDDLTPREREVFDLVQRGLTNEEIAVRLGITLDGANYHVSQILSKLGVASREEAAAAALGEPRRWWAAWPLWARIAGAGVVAAAVTGLAVLAWGVIRTEGPTDDARSQPADDADSLSLAPCPSEPPQNIHVDWVNFVRFNGVFYVSNFGEFRLAPADIGDAYDSVRCKQDGYRARDGRYGGHIDGDAAFLEPGTQVYTVEGYDPKFRVAAPVTGINLADSSGQEERFFLYEAFSNTEARVGSDLLDLEGKVRSIDISSASAGAGRGSTTINDPDEIEDLVQMVLDAPVDPAVRQYGNVDYFIEFDLTDGPPAVRRPYWAQTGELGPGIFLPDDFREAIERALAPNP